MIEGWKRIDNHRGYINLTTGQNLIVTKREFGDHYFVTLSPLVKEDEEEGRKVSPEYATESKAEAFAIAWMKKHPKGTE